MAAVAVLLLDGFGNWTIYQRQRDCVTIVYKHRTFEKTADYEQGLSIYRLAGYPQAAVRHAPIIAHILRPRIVVDPDETSPPNLTTPEKPT